MRTYRCRYLANGTIHGCVVRALSASAAAERMRLLPWSVGCGPVGRPRPERDLTPLAAMLSSGLVILAIGAAAVLSGPVEPDAMLALLGSVTR